MYRAVPVPISAAKLATLRDLGMSEEEIERMINQEVWRNDNGW